MIPYKIYKVGQNNVLGLDLLWVHHRVNSLRYIAKAYKTIGGPHHQKYKDVKLISKYKAGLRNGRYSGYGQILADGQIKDGLVFLHETEHPKHEYFRQMINGPVAYIELEHEIVKWTSSIANSLALICITVHKRCSVASNGSA